MDVDQRADDVIKEDEDVADAAIPETPESKSALEADTSEGVGSDKTLEWVEWRECSDSIELSPTSTDTPDTSQFASLPNGEVLESEAESNNVGDLVSSEETSVPLESALESEGCGRRKEGDEDSV